MSSSCSGLGAGHTRSCVWVPVPASVLPQPSVPAQSRHQLQMDFHANILSCRFIDDLARPSHERMQDQIRDLDLDDELSHTGQNAQLGELAEGTKWYFNTPSPKSSSSVSLTNPHASLTPRCAPSVCSSAPLSPPGENGLRTMPFATPPRGRVPSACNSASLSPAGESGSWTMPYATSPRRRVPSACSSAPSSTVEEGSQKRRPRQGSSAPTVPLRTQPGFLAKDKNSKFYYPGIKNCTAQLRNTTNLGRKANSIEGSVVQLSFDKTGCRKVQQALEDLPMHEASLLAQEMAGCVCNAIESPHANFVIQRFVETLPADSLDFVFEELKGVAVNVAKHRYGCRVLTRLVTYHASHSLDLLAQIIDKTKLICRNEYARHVFCSILEHGTETQRSQIIFHLQTDVVNLGRHRYGSYVLESALRHAGEKDRQALLAIFVEPNVLFGIAQSESGKHVLQTLIARCPREFPIIMQSLAVNALGFARHRRASALVESVLNSAGNQDCHALVAAIIKPETLLALAKDVHGCRVIMSLLANCGDCKRTIQQTLVANIDMLAHEGCCIFLPDLVRDFPEVASVNRCLE